MFWSQLLSITPWEWKTWKHIPRTTHVLEDYRSQNSSLLRVFSQFLKNLTELHSWTMFQQWSCSESKLMGRSHRTQKKHRLNINWNNHSYKSQSILGYKSNTSNEKLKFIVITETIYTKRQLTPFCRTMNQGG